MGVKGPCYFHLFYLIDVHSPHHQLTSTVEGAFGQLNLANVFLGDNYILANSCFISPGDNKLWLIIVRILPKAAVLLIGVKSLAFQDLSGTVKLCK